MTTPGKPGQVWASTATGQTGRTFRVMRTDETYAYTLTFTTGSGDPIPSYLQKTGRVALKNLNRKRGYRLVHDPEPKEQQ